MVILYRYTGNMLLQLSSWMRLIQLDHLGLNLVDQVGLNVLSTIIMSSEFHYLEVVQDER